MLVSLSPSLANLDPLDHPLYDNALHNGKGSNRWDSPLQQREDNVGTVGIEGLGDISRGWLGLGRGVRMVDPKMLQTRATKILEKLK